MYRESRDDVLTLAAEVRDHNERASWDNTHELLAQIIDSLSLLRLEMFLIAGVPRWKLPNPYRVPRPGEEQEVTVITPSQFARLSVTG